MADDLGKKISELPETTDLQRLYTIGTDKNTSSKKVSLEFLRQAADYANAQGDYAKSVGDTVAGNVGATDYPVFSASGVYAIGDVVRYADRLYRFTAPHQAGAWNGADVELTSVNEEAQRKVSELKQETDQKLTELESKFNRRIITLKGIISNGSDFHDWIEGDICFNKGSGLLRKAVTVENGDAIAFETVEWENDALYFSNGVLWKYNGATLLPISNIELSSITNNNNLSYGQFYWSSVNKKIGILTSPTNVDAVYYLNELGNIFLRFENTIYYVDSNQELKIVLDSAAADVKISDFVENYVAEALKANIDYLSVVFIGGSGTDYAPNWKVGDIMYNYATGLFRQCLNVANGDAISFQTVDLLDGSIFRYGDVLWLFEGGTIKVISNVLKLGSITNSDNVGVGGIYYSSTNKDFRMVVGADGRALPISISEHCIFIYESYTYIYNSADGLILLNTGNDSSITIVNNLSDGGITSALSAEQGKILNNPNTSSPVVNRKNIRSIATITTDLWQAFDSYGRIGDNVSIFDEASQNDINVLSCVSNNTNSITDGARFIAKLPIPVDMRYNVLQGGVCEDMDFPVADKGNVNISLYSDNIIDNNHRVWITLNYGYLNIPKENYVRNGWSHFCVNIYLQGERGASFNPQNVTHVGFNVNHAANSSLTCYVNEWRIVRNLVKPGIVTIVDNFNPNVPAMANYAASKGIPLNLSIVPNWVGDNSKHGTLKQIYKAASQGHFIFNHTWNHQIYGGQTDIEVFEQIDKANKWMIERGFVRGAKVLSVPSAAFDNQKYQAFLGSEAQMVYHHWTPLTSVPKTREDSTPQCVLYYPYGIMSRLLNISALDSSYADNFDNLAESAIIGANAAIEYGGIMVFGFHGYGTQYGGYMPDDAAWKEYIDAISALDIHHYTLDEILEGCYY